MLNNFSDNIGYNKQVKEALESVETFCNTHNCSDCQFYRDSGCHWFIDCLTMFRSERSESDQEQ